MREALKSIVEQRATFTGTFNRFGAKTGWKGRLDKTILLTDIKDVKGKLVCDHLWFNYTNMFASLVLEVGDVVQFDARVKQYEKGYKGSRQDVYATTSVDYKLSHPTKISVMSR